MAPDVDAKELRRAVERMHNCTARLAQSVPVSETFEGQPVWEGTVHVFDLEGHPTAARGLCLVVAYRGLTSVASLLYYTSRPLLRPQMRCVRLSSPNTGADSGCCSTVPR